MAQLKGACIDALGIKVTDKGTGKSKALMWFTDHAQTYAQHQINAVQFQVCSSLRFFCELLLLTTYQASGEIVNGSTLSRLLAECHITWEPIDPSDISL